MKSKIKSCVSALMSSPCMPRHGKFESVRLEAVCRPDRRLVRPTSGCTRDLLYVSLDNIDPKTGTIVDPVPAKDKNVLSVTHMFDTRHVLYGKLRPYLNKVAIPDFQGICTTEIVPMLPNENICREYLYYFLRTQAIVSAAMRSNTGSRMPRANLKSLLKEHIPLPPLRVQRRIARVLATQMGLAATCENAIEEQLEAIRVLPAALLSHVFSKIGGGGRVSLGDTCEIHSGSTPVTSRRDFWGGRITWVTPADLGRLDAMRISDSRRRITQIGLKAARLRVLPSGTIIMSSRAPVGHLAIAGAPLAIGTGCKGFVPGPRVSGEFLYWALMSDMPAIRNLSNKTTFEEVKKSTLSRFEILLPSLNEQVRVAAEIQGQMKNIKKVRLAAQETSKASAKLPSALLDAIYGRGSCHV